MSEWVGKRNSKFQNNDELRNQNSDGIPMESGQVGTGSTGGAGWLFCGVISTCGKDRPKLRLAAPPKCFFGG